jgi:hypothetical protein
MAVNRSGKNGQKEKEQIIAHTTLHRKCTIEQHEHHRKR